MAKFVLKEMCSQPYSDTVFSAGLVEGHAVDTIYLKLAREVEEPTVILFRRDEALAVLWVLSGALWSEGMERKEAAGVVCHDGYEFCATCGTALGAEE
jgi:hypothetical protein